MSIQSAKQADKQDATNTEQKANDKLRHSKYYEHDGALRAYANRTIVLAFLCVPMALASLAFAIYVRIQPPTVIRVDANGEAVLLNGKSKSSPGLGIAVAQGADADPTDFEKRAFVRLFLTKYLNFSAADVAINWADSLNMMTLNLRQKALNAMKDDNTVGKIEDDQTNSIFHLRSIEPAKDDPMSFVIFGVKEIHRVRDRKEDFDKVVGEFHIRLVSEKRSETNPSGLLVADYWEHEIEGERRDAILRDTSMELSH
jgi:hypothetical protein